MVTFDPTFFEPETRDGFYIEPLIKNAWAAQIETLSIFDAICTEHNLKYSLDWGTLLGAVRHGGYIPWDDDLDVCMPRRDLMKFFDIVEDYPQVICINAYNDPDLAGHATRLNLTRRYLIERDLIKEHHGFPLPVGIDIFSIDYVPRDKERELKLNKIMLKINHVINLLDGIKENPSEAPKYRNTYLNSVREIRREVSRETSVTFAIEEPTLQDMVILYNELQMQCDESDADYITEYQCIIEGGNYYLPKDTYEHTIRIPFENVTACVPINYNEVLKYKYGDNYMVPVNSGGSHGYPFYDVVIESIMDRLGKETFEDAKSYIERISSDYYRGFLNRSNTPVLTFTDEQLNRTENSRILAAMLEVLAEVKRLCEMSNISYYYIGDTANEINDIESLSSESTDIHLGMKRSDYLEFQKLLQEDLGAWFDYRSIYTHSDHADISTYVITDAYLTNEGEYEARFHGCSAIVGLDISPIDVVSDDDNVEALKGKIMKSLLDLAPSMPTEPPYTDAIIEVVKQYEDMLGSTVNLEGNLQNEFVKLADSVAMSDALPDDSVGYKRVRITPEVVAGDYRLYDKTDFD